MNLYSFNGNEPTPLPQGIYLTEDQTESGLPEYRTSLDELDISTLNSYGFSGPYTQPEYNDITQYLIWDSGKLEYIVNNYSDEQIKSNLLSEQKKNIKIDSFINEILSSKLYLNVRYQSTQDLLKNTIATEFLSFLNEIKSGFLSASKAFDILEKYIAIIIKVFNLTEDQLLEFNEILERSNLSSVINIPTQEFLSNLIYDAELNTLINDPNVDTSNYTGPPPPTNN